MFQRFSMFKLSARAQRRDAVAVVACSASHQSLSGVGNYIPSVPPPHVTPTLPSLFTRECQVSSQPPPPSDAHYPSSFGPISRSYGCCVSTLLRASARLPAVMGRIIINEAPFTVNLEIDSGQKSNGPSEAIIIIRANANARSPKTLQRQDDRRKDIEYYLES